MSPAGGTGVGGAFASVYGVDFSGAKLAGRTTWVARLEPGSGGPGRPGYRLAELYRLADACGTAERAPALAHLTGQVLASSRALWSFDFPFGFPVEVIGAGCGWAD